MAGRVKIRWEDHPSGVGYVYPELCPAWDGQGSPPACVIFPGTGIPIRQCPLMYGSEAWIERAYARHISVEAFGLDMEINPQDVYAMRVLCCAAPASGTEPGAFVRRSK